MMLAALAAAAALTGAEDVEKLAWMAGSWAQEYKGVTVRETWLRPIDGVMSGVSQTNGASKTAFVEYMKISAEPAGATFTATIPGQPPTPFVLVSSKPGEATFENKTHDFPQRVIYRRCGVDLCARIEGLLGGKLQSDAWRYTRVK
jgi:hypothetical protein